MKNNKQKNNKKSMSYKSDDMELLKKLLFGGPTDPLKPIASSQESINMKPMSIIADNTDQFKVDNMFGDFNAKMESNPITPAERIAYKTYTTGDYQAPKNRMSDKTMPMSMQREKAFGGLTNNEKSLVDNLKRYLDKPVADVSSKKYSMGGQVISTLAGLIPGVGGVLSPMVKLIDQQIDQNKQPGQEPMPMVKNTNMYGDQMENGGVVTKNFKQYNTGSHASGNDLSINPNGTPSGNGTSSVQNKENAYTNKKGSSYVYSDVLPNPETGNTFNVDAAKLNKKFKNADKYVEDKNALDFTMDRLSILNDKVRSIKESVEMACGGRPKKMAYGGGPDDPVIPPAESIAWNGNVNNQYLLDAELSIPPSENSMWDADLNQLYEGAANPPTTSKSAPNTSLPDLSGLVKPVGKKKVMGATEKTGTLDDFDFNIPAVALKGLGLAKSAVDALTPAEVEKTILPDYRKSDKQMYSTNIDYTQAKQDALAASNLAGNVNRSASGSFEQMQGRQANNYANYADAIGNISMKEALDRNQQYVQRAGYEQGKAVDTANRNTQNRINNQQNAANADLADQKFFSELTDVGSQFNKYEYYQDMVKNKKEIANATINEGLMLIGSKYSNFGFSEDFMERIKSGTASMDEMVKFMSTTEKIKSGTKTTK